MQINIKNTALPYQRDNYDLLKTTISNQTLQKKIDSIIFSGDVLKEPSIKKWQNLWKFVELTKSLLKIINNKRPNTEL